MDKDFAGVCAKAIEAILGDVWDAALRCGTTDEQRRSRARIVAQALWGIEASLPKGVIRVDTGVISVQAGGDMTCSCTVVPLRPARERRL